MGELEELVREAAAGDRSAFASLMEPHMSAAYRAALAVLGSPDDAREAVQEAALRAWQRLPQLRDAAAFPAWFRRIATRAALDMSRRAYRVRELTLAAPNELFYEDPAPHTDDSVAVLAALARLSHDERALLGLRYGADLTVPDAAAALGINEGTAKARLHRALKKVRAELERE